MKRSLLSLTLVVGAITSIVPGQQSGADAAATREDILRLFDAMQVRSQMKLVMVQMTQQIKAMSHDELKRSNAKLTDAEIAKMDAMSEQVTKDMPVDGMLDDMIPVYQRHLSKSDVDAMIGFYSTPTGQKMIREMPAIAAEGMQAMQPRLLKQMDEAKEKIEQMAREGAQKQQKSAPPSATPKN